MLDTLPTLADGYRLAPSDAAAFDRDGHLVLRGVASQDEAAAFRTAIREGVRRHSTETRPLADRDTYGRAFLQVPNLWRHDEAVARFVLAKRFARLAADLLGVPAVRLYHDQALFKEPGGGPTPWHQDGFYWPLATQQTVTMWMPLVDVPAGMDFVSGSHRHGDLGRFEISDASEQHFRSVIADRQLPVMSTGSLRAGDASFHAGWTLHRAPGNQTNVMREVMTVIWFADGTTVGAADSPQRHNDLQTWLPGLSPGDVAASPLNPRLP